MPNRFSWVDHRLVRERHLERCTSEALALYLFLVTVADAKGLSYYGDASVRERLGWSAGQLRAARRGLIEADLIAYEAPLYQVLSLDPVPPRGPTHEDRGPRRLAGLLRDAGVAS